LAKVVTPEELLPIVERERKAGKTIVFANGAFDLLHVGHTRYLRGAAQVGDILVVALNSDISVRALKGPGRPILPLEERLALVCAIEGVDYVTSFDETKVTRLLLMLKPDFHAKGTDYTKDNVPEVDDVRSYGGNVAITGDPKDHNTTDIIGKIKSVERGDS
jgi:D-glycero-beta-D-manno-heptose 1-phosphate adenylyltransferase